MPKEKDEELAMEINCLKKDLEISLQKSIFLERENQELRLELNRLKSQIQSLKALNNERKSILWKKFHSSMDMAVAGADSPPLNPATVAGDKREVTKFPKQSSWDDVKESQRMTAVPASAPPPPPPPLPKKLLGGSKAVRRVPEVLDLYRTLTKRDAQKENKVAHGGAPVVAFTKNMIGEIENRSAYLSAIKSEVETHGEFVNWLIKEVEMIAPRDISDVEKFVKWLDVKLASLVDERAVLKHFPRWPEAKADALREAAFSYRDLKSLESKVCMFRDNPKEEMNVVLKRAQALQDRVEQSVSNMERTREFNCKKYQAFQIPCQWMFDSALPTQIKSSTLRLAKEYMIRITRELRSTETSQAENLFLQGVRFAYRVHQYAGGFDSEAIEAFEGLKKAGLSSQRK
ncbi:protein CHUP1, chloroplastic isoform X1 [Cucumis melo]|uniref:Protein CHUP1, chloroplastic isoform X1 n=1 Tax=Cucumis melo TaxID=3656 RepID=A0A1S3C4V9_CUCME|nr:protein CHUP1, chloroplastic isoform X1 [Cucumis melo]